MCHPRGSVIFSNLEKLVLGTLSTRRFKQLKRTPRVTAAQARALIAVADAGSYAGAGAATGLAQPLLHRSIGDLSVALRRALVVREGKGIKLTEPGRKSTRAFRLACVELDAGLAELAALSGRETGCVSIGAMRVRCCVSLRGPERPLQAQQL